VRVPLGDRAYDIHIGVDDLAPLRAALDRVGRGAVGLVTDSNVAPLYAARVQAEIAAAGRRCVTHVMPAGEAGKQLERIGEICGAFLAGGLDRAGVVVALGGGVVGDMAGFAAAVFMRGVPFIQMPTTIVAQVDSSVGGKTGVNHPLGKNTIGAFHQPAAVVIDMGMLRTLPPRELRAGMAEVIKHGVIADAALFEYLEGASAGVLRGDLDALRTPVLRSCEIKAAVVAEDEHEHGRRADLNYGHTFGHAIETASHYERFLHGEAVALGMCAAGALARNLGLVDEAFVSRQEACIAAYGLPVRWPEMPVDETLAAMKSDKKARAGTLKFVLATRMGAVVHRTDVTPDAVRAALETLR
jgi:3-dehydroquinate synthase